MTKKIDYKESTKYNEHTGLAIHAMMQAAIRDEFVDTNPPVKFPSAPNPHVVNNLREWKLLRKKYKDAMEVAIGAMTASALAEYNRKEQRK